jgi:hypothetical protein
MYQGQLHFNASFVLISMEKQLWPMKENEAAYFWQKLHL